MRRVEYTLFAQDAFVAHLRMVQAGRFDTAAAFFDLAEYGADAAQRRRKEPKSRLKYHLVGVIDEVVQVGVKRWDRFVEKFE